MFQVLWVQGQCQPQVGAFVLASLDAKLAPHQHDQLTGNDQSQMAAKSGGGQKVLAVQFSIQQGFTLPLINRLAGILYRDAQTRRP